MSSTTSPWPHTGCTARSRQRFHPRASGTANAASPTMPFSTPIEVMPIWIVDRKRVGSAPSRRAAPAARSPASSRTCSRALRAVSSATSDSANRPFSSISAKRTTISMRVVRRRNIEERRGVERARQGTRTRRTLRRDTRARRAPLPCYGVAVDSRRRTARGARWCRATGQATPCVGTACGAEDRCNTC